MTTELFREQSELVLDDVSRKYGFGRADLLREELVVAAMREGTKERIVALFLTAGLGTVASVEAGLVQWVREHAPKDRHFRAMQPFFLAEMAAEARRQGFEGARAYGNSLGFALAKYISPPELPDRLRLIVVDVAWMAGYRNPGVFDNALGEAAEPSRIERTKRGFAVVDDTNEPLAVAGIWNEGERRDEIGVDVRRDARGLGLAKVLTIAATNDILQRGRVPFY